MGITIEVEGEGVKILGGGTQSYNKDNRDKRRPLIMTSPGQMQKARKRANDPDIQELEGVVVNLSEELGMAYTTIEGLNKTLAETELALEASKVLISKSEIALAKALKPAPKKRSVPKKAAPKKAGD